MKKEERKSGDGASFRKPWKHSENMSFLKDVFAPRETISNFEVIMESPPDLNVINIPFTEVSSPPSPSPSDPVLSNSPATQQCYTTPSRQPSTTPLPISSSSKKRKAKEDAIETLMRIEQEKIEEIKKMSSKKEPDDEDYHFFMSLLPYMRNMPPRLKLKTRAKLQNVILEALDEEQI